MTTFVHPFDSGTDDPQLLGGKGASLARMAALGVPVPPGFTVGTAAWRARRDGAVDPDALWAEVVAGIAELERRTGRRFGDPDVPLLLSVRSGAPVSMPGMMDTVLNVGLTDAVAANLGAHSGTAFADALRRRLHQCFAEVVAADAEAAVPAEPLDQLRAAVEAVWRSWDAPRARRYRRYRGISEDLGTAVTVQTMVFGNRDDRSGTGVVFTRDPAGGAPEPYGDFLLRAQGEDVVSGGMTPAPLAAAAEQLPEAFAALRRQLPVLERAYRDMCDVEFTVESGELWILQARVGQRSGAAAVRIAADLVDEGLIDREEALRRIPVAAVQDLQAPVRAPGDALPELGRGLPASPGTGVGEAVFDAQRAEALADEGRDVVLVRPETSPHDVGGMIAARAVVTAAGGRASHAAVVARGLGRPAVCGVEGLLIDGATATFPSGAGIAEGDVLTVDGLTGEVLRGAARLVAPTPHPALRRVLQWCAERERVPVLDAVPAGATRVRGPEDVVDGLELAAVDLDWEGSASARLLRTTCAALHEAGCGAWLLVLPAALRGADPDPPAGPWTGVVAAAGSAWAAELLATRIEVDAGVPTRAAS